MICSKCQTLNNDQSKFCIKCGTLLQVAGNEQLGNITSENIVQPVQQAINPNTVIQQNSVTEPVNINMQPVQEVVENNNKIKGNFSLIDYLKLFLINPNYAFEKNEQELNDPKNALILSGIIAVFMMIVTFIKTIITVVVHKGYDGDISIDFKMLEHMKFSDLIFKNLFIFVGIIAVIAFVYYVVGLVFKKSSNYLKLLAATASSLIPYTLIGMFLGTILSYIWSPLSVIAMIIGGVATLVIFINLIEREFNFDTNDQKILFHMICLSVILIAGYFMLMKMVESSITGGLDDFMDMFS